MALVTVTDLKTYMSSVSFTNAQAQTAQMVLDGTQEELELYLGRPVQPVQVREKRRSDGSGDIALSVTPVQRVIDVRLLTQTDSTIPTKDVTPLSPEEVDRIWDAMPEDNITIPGGIYVGRWFTWYIVEYIGGYNGYVDNALKLAILEVASRTMTVNHDDVLSIKDDIAREPANEARIQKGWRDEELKRFDRIRRRTAYR